MHIAQSQAEHLFELALFFMFVTSLKERQQLKKMSDVFFP